MPEISRFFGISIRILFNDHNPPHFHAYYQNYGAVYGIDDIERIRGKMPPKVERIIVKWAEQYQKELLNNWELMISNKPLIKIAGADK